MRRKKMNFHDLYLLNVEYYDCSRITHPLYGKGWIYKLCKPLTDHQLTAVIRFQNTLGVTVKCEYAPEIKHKGLILFDKCI